MGVEVGWLLQQHEIEGMKLIAGEKGLQKVMEKVNLLDNPDMIRWIKDGEFLITAGYILNEDQQLQQTFISELAKHHCVGLGIKLKRYMDRVPQVMLEQAEEYSLPIIELPYDRSFAEITSFLYRRIFRQEISEEKQYALIYNRISEIVIRDRGRQELLQAIADSDGDDDVVIYLRDIKNIKILPQNLRVKADGALMEKLTVLFGKENVKFITKPIENRSKID